MPTIAGKTHNSRHIHMNIDIIEEESEINMLHIIRIKYALKQN